VFDSQRIDKGADFIPTTGRWLRLSQRQNISNDVADLLGIPNGEVGATLAHNFIELAIDLHLYQNQIEIWNIYKSGLEEVTNNFAEISQCLGSYLGLTRYSSTRTITGAFLNPQT
jgi:hypothetical protein